MLHSLSLSICVMPQLQAVYESHQRNGLTEHDCLFHELGHTVIEEHPWLVATEGHNVHMMHSLVSRMRLDSVQQLARDALVPKERVHHHAGQVHGGSILLLALEAARCAHNLPTPLNLGGEEVRAGLVHKVRQLGVRHVLVNFIPGKKTF